MLQVGFGSQLGDAPAGKLTAEHTLEDRAKRDPAGTYLRSSCLRPRRVNHLDLTRAFAEHLDGQGEPSLNSFAAAGDAPNQVVLARPGLNCEPCSVEDNLIGVPLQRDRVEAWLDQQRFAASMDEIQQEPVGFFQRHNGVVLEHRLQEVEERVERACARSGRRRDEITVVAVTKVFGVEVILKAYELGMREFGENYVQEFAGKAPAVRHLSGARFHLIGHLQSNKSKQASELFDVIQTVDTAKLAQRLDGGGKAIDVMIEIKLSPEDTKHGAAPEDLPALVAAVRGCANLRLRGLMTMPPWSDEAEPSRPYFRRLRELAEQHRLGELSMGMSHDFEVAIEEGATHIRIGTALFGSRRRP